MPSRIVDYCKHTGQIPPSDAGEILRCALESLALKYRWVLEKLEAIRGRAIDVIHVVGGGARNQTLCQFTADATGTLVIAGPIEATAIGNIAVQAIASGLIESISEARVVVRRSFNVITYEPQNSAGWDEAYERFLKITGLSS
jgi:rhamnulokinase